VAVTGASGAPYALRVIQGMTAAGVHVHLVISPPGRRLFAEELMIQQPDAEILAGRHADRVTAYEYGDVGCRLASGSFLTDGMVVCPCSSNTLGSIAGGLADNLIARAAQVTLKERRRLVLVPRETPISAIDLENQLRVARAGGIICPASPGFYMQPREIDDLVRFVAGRVLDLFNVSHDWKTRWQG
jgi:4-hydroxy-3-polyprenylbenzoate decarboxylase